MFHVVMVLKLGNVPVIILYLDMAVVTAANLELESRLKLETAAGQLVQVR
jgi:hypothetical protein